MSNNGTIQDLIDMLTQTRDELMLAIQNGKVNPNQIQINSIADLSKYLGLITAGEFRAGNQKDPGQGFTGTRIVYPSVEYLNQFWNVITANNDAFQVGFNVNGEFWSGGGNIRQNASGLYIYSGGINTGAFQSNGNFFMGSNIGAAGTTSLAVFSTATTYNGESMVAGDILIGNNSASQPNMKWSMTLGQLQFRSGTIIQSFMSGGGFTQIGARLHSSVNWAVPATGSNQQLVFDTVDYDDAGFTNLVADATKITIPVGYGGRYYVGFYVMISPYTNPLLLDITVLYNGSISLCGDSTLLGASKYRYGGGIDATLNDGDFIQLNFWTTNAATAFGTNNHPALYVRKIR